MRRSALRLAAVAAALLLLLAACGSDDDNAGTDDTGAPTTQEDPADDPVAEDGTTVTIDAGGGRQEEPRGAHRAQSDDAGATHDDAGDDLADELAGDADHVVEIAYADGAVVGGPATIETATGESVLLVVTSDIDEELHVHGADVYGNLTAGQTTEIAFTAEIPGQFEIELEGRGQLLATLITT